MDPTNRFTSRADCYAQSRPRYPAEILDFLRDHIGFTFSARVADIGSGTGISSELFLEHGNAVWGVEPNGDMRLKAESLLSAYPAFRSIKGTAEHTKLASHSFDLIVAAQAFHWFDPETTRLEFERIGKPDGHVLLLWNIREMSSDFGRAYEALLVKYGTDYLTVGHQALASEERVAKFFVPGRFRTASFDNGSLVDYEQLKGRLLSTSYAPGPEREQFTPMLHELEQIFDRYAQDGHVPFGYTTYVYLSDALSTRPLAG